MRLDKYLQVTGLIKRRALANEACKRDLVKINGQPAKATKEVAVGDVIEIILAKREITAKVLQEIKGTSLKKSIRNEYFEILKDVSKKIEDDDDFWE
jgi:ribosomal 50S subunit-recycling heat shock protein